MPLRTQYEFLFVGRDEGSFVENYAYDLGEGGEQSGKIFINLEIQNNLAEAEMIGETLFDTVRKGFYADLEKDPYNRFENALKEVNKALNNLKNEKSNHYIGQLHVLIAAIIGNNLYLTQCGDAEGYLVRRRFCTTVTEDLSDPESQDTFTNIASGTLELGDFVLLSSTRLLRYITKTDLARIAAAKNLVAALGELKDFLSTEILNRVGFIGIGVTDQVPAFSPKEKNQVVAHLEKEEEYEQDGVRQHKDMKVMVTDFGKQFLSFVSDAKNRMVSKGKNSSLGGKILRGSGSSQDGFVGNWSKDKIFAALIITVLVLTLGIWWLRGKAAEQEKINQYTATLTEVQETIGSAETTGQYDKDRAGQMLTDAEQKALQVLNSGFNRSKANELLSAIKEQRDKLDSVVRVQPKVLVDLAQKRPNVSALGIVALQGNLFAYEYNALYPILVDTVRDPLTIDDNETVISGTAFEDNDSLLFFTKEGRVLEYKDNRFTSVVAAEGAFHKGFSVKAYGSKLYILDPAGNQIWKYTRRRDQFDTAEKYNIDADLSKGISFAIDGDVYVLNSDGSITKLSSGNKQDYAIKRLPVKALTTPTKVYTELDMQQIYVLEPSEHRVMVYYKDENTGSLVYSAQYVFEELNDVRDLYVDKNSKKLYLVDPSKVYQIDLQ